MKSKKDLKKDFSEPTTLIKTHIPINGKIILGLSGGADSVFLFQLCLQIQKTHPFKIIIAHINHGIRGEDSKKDAIFAEKLAKNNLCEFELHTIKSKPKGNLEGQFRKIRYEFFEKTRKKHKADLILTAHHLNDNIETILLNIVRGCHLDGLNGMNILDQKRHLFRPLLTTPKNDILKYLKNTDINFRNDSTNLDTDYSRNLIRHKVIPELKKINKSLEKSFLQNIKNFHSVREQSNKSIKEWVTTNTDQQGINIIPFLSLDLATQKSVLFHLYKTTYGNLNGLSQNHADQILKIISQNRSNRQKEFGPDFLLKITRAKDSGHKYIRILKKKSKQVQ